MATATETKVNPMGKPAAAPVAAAAPTTTAKPQVTGAELAANARKGRKLVDPNETPEQSFKRLTEPRVTKALRSIQLLRNLSRFKPSDAHRDKVFSTIKRALLVAEESWKSNEIKTDEGFKL